MSSVRRSAVADAVETLLLSATLSKRVEIRRRWGDNSELADDCARITIIPGGKDWGRDDLASVVEDHTLTIVVQSRVSTGAGTQPDGDHEETDIVDEIAEDVRDALPASLTVSGEDLQLQSKTLEDFDADDWAQRRLFTTAILATYRQWLAM